VRVFTIGLPERARPHAAVLRSVKVTRSKACSTPPHDEVQTFAAKLLRTVTGRAHRGRVAHLAHRQRHGRPAACELVVKHLLPDRLTAAQCARARLRQGAPRRWLRGGPAASKAPSAARPILSRWWPRPRRVGAYLRGGDRLRVTGLLGIQRQRVGSGARSPRRPPRRRPRAGTGALPCARRATATARCSGVSSLSHRGRRCPRLLA
jgi:hypothetical protein